MKKLFTLMMLGAGFLSAHAQYQLANAGFEDWEETTKKYGTLKTVKSSEPVSWSSFATMTTGGSAYNLAANDSQLTKSEDCRPGSTGTYSAYIIGKSVFGVEAQGNLTNGCVYGGSMTPEDAKGNYNFTNESDPGQAMRFTGRPDAVKVWIKASTAYPFNISIILHEKGYYQDPFENAGKCAKLIAHAKATPASNNSVWTEYTVPFVYDDTTPGARGYYALATFATSGTPGKASVNDKMWIDDVVMVYNSELATATYDGSKVSFSGTSATVDALYDESKLALTSNGAGATIEKSYDEVTAVLTITVKGDNISEDANNKHVYTIQFTVPSSELDMAATKYNGSAVAFVDGSATVDALYEEGLLNLVPVHSTASVEKSYDEETAILTVTVKGDNISEDNTNYHVYTIQFTVPSSELDVAATKYNGSAIAFVDGSATVDALYEEGSLNLVPVHSSASVEKSYDEETAILTVTVKGANFAKDAANKHVYTIQFKKPVVEIEVPMTIGAYYGTFCAPFDADLPVFGMGFAYTVDGLEDDGATLRMTELETSIPAHTPVVVYCYFYEKWDGTRKGFPTEGTPKAGLLTGTYKDIKAPKGSYVLQKQGEKVGFYKVEDVQPTVKAYHAYLNVPDSNVKAFGFSMENGETAIKALEALTSGKPEIYDLNGRKLNKLQKGMNIVNGMKVLVK